MKKKAHKKKLHLYHENFYYLSVVCKGFSHPARITILQYLFDNGTASNKELVEWLGLSQSTVSQHLEVLREAGLIASHIVGVSVFYELEEEMIAKLSLFCKSLLDILAAKN